MAKRRVGTYKGKPIIEGDPNLLNENELFGGSRVYIKTLKAANVTIKDTAYTYASTFSAPENVLIPSNVKVFSVVGNNTNGELILIEVKDIIPALLGVLVVANSEETAAFASTKKNPIRQVPGIGVGVVETMPTKDFYLSLDPNSLPTDDVKNSVNIQLYAFSNSKGNFNQYGGANISKGAAIFIFPK